MTRRTLTSRFSSSRRKARVQAPVITQVAGLIARHPGTISLGQGVVYYGPPPAVFTSLSGTVADKEANRYGLTGGMPALLDLVADKLRRENGIRPENGSHIIVTAGKCVTLYSTNWTPSVIFAGRHTATGPSTFF